MKKLPSFACCWLAALFGASLCSPLLSTHSARYPQLDARLVDWPFPKNRGPGEQSLVQLDCFNELDASFVNPNVLYRVRADHRGNCLVHIPASSRVTFELMHFTSKQSTVTILAGSSPVFLPIRSPDVHKDDRHHYGPWHVPCRSAYLVLRARGAAPEWVDFRLGAETAEDRREGPSDLECAAAEAQNFALEYVPGEEENENGLLE